MPSAERYRKEQKASASSSLYPVVMLMTMTVSFLCLSEFGFDLKIM